MSLELSSLTYHRTVSGCVPDKLVCIYRMLKLHTFNLDVLFTTHVKHIHPVYLHGYHILITYVTYIYFRRK